jgi:hypothetical protein
MAIRQKRVGPIIMATILAIGCAAIMSSAAASESIGASHLEVSGTVAWGMITSPEWGGMIDSPDWGMIN